MNDHSVFIASRTVGSANTRVCSHSSSTTLALIGLSTGDQHQKNMMSLLSLATEILVRVPQVQSHHTLQPGRPVRLETLK
jgi:hypothetical protein